MSEVDVPPSKGLKVSNQNTLSKQEVALNKVTLFYLI